MLINFVGHKRRKKLSRCLSCDFVALHFSFFAACQRQKPGTRLIRWTDLRAEAQAPTAAMGNMHTCQRWSVFCDEHNADEEFSLFFPTFFVSAATRSQEDHQYEN